MGTKRKWTARKIFKAEMAHQLTRSYTKACQTLHGHSYTIEVVLETERLDADNMVVDFKHVKEICAQVIEPLDHSVMLHDKEDPVYLETIQDHNTNVHIVPFNPTAEAMAAYIHALCGDLLSKFCSENDRKFDIKAVRVHETATGYAQYEECGCGCSE